MEMLITNTYKMRNPTKETLTKNGFFYNSVLSSPESGTDFYTLFFPLIKHNNKTTILGQIDVELSTGEVFVNTLKADTKTSYHPFYNSQCPKVYSKIIKKINKEFENMFNKLSVYNINCKEGDTVG